MSKVGGEVQRDEKRVPQTYFSVTLRADGVVWLARTAAVYPSIQSVHDAYDHFLRVVDDWLLDRRMKLGLLGTKARTPMSWLYDVRASPVLRNDPEFEQVVQARRADLLQRSPVLGILVRTAAGRMQLSRLLSTAKADIGVFDDFEEAAGWLRERQARAFPS